MIERASAIDMMELVAGTTPAAGQVGAVLISSSGHTLDLDTVRLALDARIRGVARLRQRLRSTPRGCGRPIWVDDADFDIAAHVNEASCPSPGDRKAVLGVAADLLAEPLLRDRPLWAATVVTGLAIERTALVIRFHHVMADGMGGLAVLARLVDGPAVQAPGNDFPRPAPRPSALFVDAMRARLRSLAHPVGGLRRIQAAVSELGSRPPRAARCSLNRPVGPYRSIEVACVPLDAFHEAARSHDVSVNDAALAAITGALSGFLRERGEVIDHLVASIPVSARTSANAAVLGNEIGVMPVALPVGGPINERMRATAAITRARKEGSRGASATLLAPLFRLLAAGRLFSWFTEHQRLVNTFVTNLRGPTSRVDFLGAPVEQFIPLTSTSGNIQVAFGIFSYAGSFTVTVVADAVLAPQLARLAEDLQSELEAVIAAGGTR